MADVFISYARTDEEAAKAVAAALTAAGHPVWRDDQLPAHRAYAEVIEERLKGAKAVVVLWSADAAKSQWVRAEADAARNAGTLIQATLDGSIPPLPFNQIQCADLTGWAGESEAPGWCKLIESVSVLAPRAESGKGRDRKAGTPRHELSVCVLPFENMSGDAEQEYFSDGICEDITTDLSKVSALGVVARNTAFTFKGRSVNVCDVARQLGVSHVLEGSVRKAGQRVRITAQLIDGDSGDHLWADRYDRDLDNIFAIQDEISKAIVAALKLTLLPEEKKAIERRGTANVEAYNMYLLARQFWTTGNIGDKRREERVMRICQRAVEVDPYYADAWAMLAMTQANLRYDFGDDIDDGFAAANAAQSIDPNIAEAYCATARRIEERGDLDGALAEIETALRIDPESHEVNKEAGRLTFRQRRFAEAARYYEKAVELMESDFHAWAMLVSCYHATDNEAGARHSGAMMVSQAEKALAQDPSNGAALGIAAGGLAVTGQVERAREWIDRALLIDPDNFNMRYNFACVTNLYLNDPDSALKLLASVLPFSKRHLRAATTDPDFDSLRENPQFQQLLAKANDRLAPPAEAKA